MQAVSMKQRMVMCAAIMQRINNGDLILSHEVQTLTGHTQLCRLCEFERASGVKPRKVYGRKVYTKHDVQKLLTNLSKRSYRGMDIVTKKEMTHLQKRKMYATLAAMLEV